MCDPDKCKRTATGSRSKAHVFSMICAYFAMGTLPLAELVCPCGDNILRILDCGARRQAPQNLTARPIYVSCKEDYGVLDKNSYREQLRVQCRADRHARAV
jgi:hypothetical protein